ARATPCRLLDLRPALQRRAGGAGDAVGAVLGRAPRPAKAPFARRLLARVGAGDPVRRRARRALPPHVLSRRGHEPLALGDALLAWEPGGLLRGLAARRARLESISRGGARPSPARRHAGAPAPRFRACAAPHRRSPRRPAHGGAAALRWPAARTRA